MLLEEQLLEKIKLYDNEGIKSIEQCRGNHDIYGKYRGEITVAD